ncbi:ABC transporter ATP-binding protein [Tannockella kyphosi]|uniref:ABC transporter ATP-binding protein n=1 Tax=Tannockella kyphosi TaxID=2899121 RepID=UPI0020128478|nr:ABC transporter ATP-binding protein [Tannockella kyphosi]
MSDKRDFSRVTPPMGMGPKGGRGPGGPKGRFQEPVKPKNTKDTIIRLLSYLGKYRLLLVIALFFVVINSVFSILATYQIRPIVNGLASGMEKTQLIKQLGLMAIIYAVAVCSNYIQSRIMLEIAQNSLARLREDLFEKMQQLPIRFFDHHQNGDLMSRFTNDVDIVNQMLSSTAVSLVSSIFTLTTTILIMFYTNWILASILLLTSPLLSIVTKVISKKTIVYYKKQQASIGALNGYIEEQVTGQKVIKVFNHEQTTIDGFKELNTSYRDKSFMAQFLGGIMGPIMGSIGQLGYILTACVGGLMVVGNRFDVGGFTIFLNYSKSFSRPINEIFSQINTVFSALAGAERVFEVMNHPSERNEGTYQGEIIGEVVLKNVDFGYREDKKVLKNISLHALPSQKIAFVGSTGAGKTTITNLLNRFYDIQSGVIEIDGKDLKEIDKKVLRENIAMVLQDTHLFTGTIMENVRYGRLDATDKEVMEACISANADKFIDRLENGYQTILTGDGSNLSGGQRQLLNIARAAISKAPILVLDEATSSVDTRTERHIEEALNRLMKARTTFVIAHRLSTVRNCDEIIVLEDGQIIESGTHQQLLEKQGKYFNLYTGLEKLG